MKKITPFLFSAILFLSFAHHSYANGWAYDPTYGQLDTSSASSFTLDFDANNVRFGAITIGFCGGGLYPNAPIYDMEIGPSGFAPDASNYIQIADIHGNPIYSTTLYMPQHNIISIDCSSGTVTINGTTLISTLVQYGDYDSIFMYDTSSPVYPWEPSYSGSLVVCSPVDINCSVEPPSVGTISFTTNPAEINNATSATASFMDSDGGSVDIAQWNWGDGNTTTGTVSESNGSGSVTNTHSYTSLGSYTVQLLVTNNNNLTGTSQTVVAVIPSGGLVQANLSHTNYNGADFSSQDLTKVNGTNAQFQNVNFSSTNLTQANFSGSNLSGSNFTNANLTKANLSNTNLTNVNFTGANLTQANLSGMTLAGDTWSNTTCPDGTNSNNDSNTCVGHL